ncbi:hypothetical protein B4096_2404 [Heyndrickxia coagulans]|jgi:phosphohistidine phosphatase SixA|nr:hypothetical protein B4100_2462 [Heyndrickxia coagulans]KYC90806.1 hypothetical protein B4096_2404 [Heyndrickxia coagulans]
MAKKMAGLLRGNAVQPQKKLFSDTVRAWPPKSAGKVHDLLNDFSRISSVCAE